MNSSSSSINTFENLTKFFQTQSRKNYENNPFKQINDEVIYSFKTDFTKYFNSRDPTIYDYIHTVVKDLPRLSKQIGLFQKDKYKVISFTNIDSLTPII